MEYKLYSLSLQAFCEKISIKNQFNLKIMKKLSIFFLLTLSFSLFAAEPTGYYNTAVGKIDAALKTQLCAIVGNHTQRTYDQLWTDFQTTDKRADGKVRDIYSGTTNYTFVTNQCGSYSKEGDCYNREHSFPKSWFGGEIPPMYTDLYHLYPSDGYVNNMRGNYPFGEVGTVTYSSNLNYCRLGSSSFSGYTGTVFEPTDSLKGDFARTYFYMVTAYDDKVASWSSPQLAGNKYPALSDWSISMFLKWNSQDPVGPKEKARNEAVYGIQHNRNPFIDHPELAEYIWGAHKGEPWSLSSGINPLKIEFTVSPNPVQNELTIQSDEANLSYIIYNLNGQILLENQLDTSGKISTGQLQNGMYLIQLKSGVRKTIQKFIVNK
jgi:endonuclease I